MEIIERKGDLIEAFINGEFTVIAHQANCFCTAKTGIAPVIFQKFPWIREADLATREGDLGKLGGISFGSEGGKTGFNLYGQYHHDQNEPSYGTQYPALLSALKEMRFSLSYRINPPSIGFPRIGCGAGGGNWDDVKKMIEEAFEGYLGKVYVYTLPH